MPEWRFGGGEVVPSRVDGVWPSYTDSRAVPLLKSLLSGRLL